MNSAITMDPAAHRRILIATLFSSAVCTAAETEVTPLSEHTRREAAEPISQMSTHPTQKNDQ